MMIMVDLKPEKKPVKLPPAPRTGRTMDSRLIRAVCLGKNQEDWRRDTAVENIRSINFTRSTPALGEGQIARFGTVSPYEPKRS